MGKQNQASPDTPDAPASPEVMEAPVDSYEVAILQFNAAPEHGGKSYHFGQRFDASEFGDEFDTLVELGAIVPVVTVTIPLSEEETSEGDEQGNE